MKKLLTLSVAIGAISMAGGAGAQERLHKINCGDDQGGDIVVQNRLIEEWEAKNPGFDVDVEYVPWGQCQSKSLTLAQAGDPPAIAYMGSRTLKQLAESELIIPVAMTDEERATYAPPILGTITANGEQWGLPRAFSTKALFWNKDLFEQAGLDPETPPATWDELYAAARAVSENTDASGIGLAAADFDNTMHQFLNYLYSNGGAVIDENGEVVFNSPQTVEAMEFYGRLAGVSQPGPTAYDRAGLRPLFQEKQIAMIISGPWERTHMPDDVEWGVAPIPAGPSGTNSTLLITDSLAIFKGSGVEDAALSLGKWLANPDNQMEFELGEGLTPLRDHPRVATLIEEDPTWAPFLASVENGGPEPLVTDYVAVQDAIIEAVQGVVLGEVDAAEAVEYAAELIEDAS